MFVSLISEGDEQRLKSVYTSPGYFNERTSDIIKITLSGFLSIFLEDFWGKYYSSSLPERFFIYILLDNFPIFPGFVFPIILDEE